MNTYLRLCMGIFCLMPLMACPPSTPTLTQPDAPVAETTPEPNAPDSPETPEDSPSATPTDTPDDTPSDTPSTEPEEDNTNHESPSFTVPANAAEIRVAISDRFLDNPGEKALLTVQLLDSDGKVINSDGFPFTFKSSNPNDFSVDANGLITALKEFGYAEITVGLQGSSLTAVQAISVASGATSGGGGGGGGGSTSSGQSVTGNVIFENLDEPT